MFKEKSFLGIVPARGGSKRLPNKNLLDLVGKPLIAWTLEAALKSRFLDYIIVSSDKDEILKVARGYDVETVKRPKELATDDAHTVDVVKHVLESMEKEYDYIVLLQPTSPLRTEKHIDEAIEFLMSKNADAVISVCETEYPPLWCNTLPEDLSMENFIRKEIIGTRSQDLPKYYRLNGAIYICKSSEFLKQGTFFLNKNIYAYIMDKKNSIDVDEEIDFLLAETLIKNKKGSHERSP